MQSDLPKAEVRTITVLHEHLNELRSLAQQYPNVAVATLNGKLYEVYLTQKDGHVMTLQPGVGGAIRVSEGRAELQSVYPVKSIFLKNVV